MFAVEYRTRVRDRIIEMARHDPRIESAAAVGGSTRDDADRWSDLDLTFGLVPDASPDEVLADLTRLMRDELDAVTLFDLPFQSSIYRVFLLPGTLQVDLSFTPGADFGAIGPRFALLFGKASEKEWPKPESAQHLFGLGVHHAVRGRYAIERGRWWQAEYWVSAVRDHALMLACRRLGLESGFGRGFDALPSELTAEAEHALVRSTDRGELLRALRAAVAMLISESDGLHPDADGIAALLGEVLD
jgi:hypothetical protein